MNWNNEGWEIKTRMADWGVGDKVLLQENMASGSIWFWTFPDYRVDEAEPTDVAIWRKNEDKK